MEEPDRSVMQAVRVGDMTQATLLIEHAAELVTVAGEPRPRSGPDQASLGIVKDGAVAAGVDGRIIAVGPTADVRASTRMSSDARVIDASGRAVLPGFVDAHTHAVFAGERVLEFTRRLAGADYLEILAAGGGILSTVRATRAVSRSELADIASTYLREMLRYGTTSVEIKSGYGLTVRDEVKMLRVVQALAEDTPLTVVGTFLGAHATPPQFQGKPDSYLDVVVNEMIPRIAEEGLARFCDVYCEKGVFTVQQSRRVLESGLEQGLAPKIHAEQKSHLGGTQLAAELHAVSADHLEHATDRDIMALAEGGTCAVLLPGAALMLGEEVQAPARRLIYAGVPVALATDFNPGTCPILSMPAIIALACVRRLLSPAEAIVASTINAAYSIGLGEEVGSLEVGKKADILILDAPSHQYIPYWFGRNLVRTVIKDGRVVV